MTQIALARHYRPTDFEAIVGQEAILRALKTALDTNRLHHAYLLTGTRGVGKTTIARILAKCMNCERGISSHPCGSCSTCLAIDQGHYVDLIEVDAASRTKVEDTRELLDNVQYLPVRGRFKIYLIDEVHMLSTHSFNALLKTLEEPPSHVKFILATTDPQKLPLTILSRCLQFHLRRLSCPQIIEKLVDILENESVPFEKEALDILATSAEGSMRDALSLLDEALAYGQGKIKATEVRTLLGLSAKGKIMALLNALIEGDSAAVFREIKEMAHHTPDFSRVLSELMTLIHQVALAQKVEETVEEHGADKEAIVELAQKASPEEIQLYYQIGLMGGRDIPYAPNPKIGFEMVLLRMLAFQPVKVVEKSEKKMPTRISAERLEKPVKINEMGSSSSPTIQKKKNQHHFPDWTNIVGELSVTGVAKMLAEHCQLKTWEDSHIHLMLDEAQKPLLNKRHEERLQEALSEYTGKKIGLKISIGDTKADTPRENKERQQKEAYLEARHMVESDTEVQRLMNTFDAELEEVIMKDN